MILKSLVIFLPSLIAGFGLLQLFWKGYAVPALGLKFFLGIGLGVGITSCLYFLRILLFPGQRGYLLIQVIFLILVIIALLLQKQFSFNISLRSLLLNRTAILFGLAFIVVAGIALYYLVTFARVTPYGDYDAQAIWNLRARFIYRSGDAWKNAFSPLINRNFHLDYPLLIPLTVVGGWNTLGSEVPRVPSVLSMVFLFGMAGVAFSLISYLRSISQAAIATTLLLATPFLLLFSTFQTADIPLTYFFLASAALFVLGCKENNRGLFFLAGLMAGLSAWTKNEGLPFILLMMICATMILGIQRARPHLLSLLAGIAFPILIVILFKTLISVENDLFTNNDVSSIVLKLFTPARYVQIFIYLISELAQLGGWPVSIIAVLVVYAWIMRVQKSNSSAEKALWILPLSQFVIYMLIYVITPQDLTWHMNYSMSRLLMHLFPMALCSFFLCVNTPESILNKVK